MEWPAAFIPAGFPFYFALPIMLVILTVTSAIKPASLSILMSLNSKLLTLSIRQAANTNTIPNPMRKAIMRNTFHSVSGVNNPSMTSL